MSWGNLKVWQRIAVVISLLAVIIIVFLYGYAFLYDYFYSQNFPTIYLTAYSSEFDPTKFTDTTISFIVEMANALKAAIT
jgi:hypothetical protein